MRITSGGNVGIGTTVPGEFVHVRRDQNAPTHLLVENATAGASAYADLTVKNNLGGLAQFGIYSSTTTTAGALASGNAFTYTTSPAMVIMANNAAGVIKFATGGLTERARFDASGNFGIGTLGPSYRLDVQGGQINASGGLCMAGLCKGTWAEVGGNSQWTNSGSNILFNTGTVGIGAASAGSPLFITGNEPSLDFATLRVKPTVTHGGIVIDSANNTSQAHLRFFKNGVPKWQFRVPFQDGVEDFRLFSWAANSDVLNVTPAGNVGIGTGATAPSAKLHVAGGTRVDGTNGRVYLGTGAATGAGGLEFIQENATTFSIRHHDPNVAWRDIVINPYAGNVGIGTTAPNSAYRLDINGHTNITGNINVTGTINAKYQDVAEWVQSTQTLAAGTVVVLDHTRSNQVIASSKAYDTRVAGVISIQPGIALGEAGVGKVLVATTGRVKIKVDASAGPIEIGDLLVTSDLEGVARKSEPLNLGGVQIHRPGTLIGKALEPLAKGTSEILVLLSLQ